MTSSRIFAIALPLLFMAVQVQFSFFTNDYNKGIRLNAGDLLLPLTGAAILYSLLKKNSLWPQWDVPGTWLWLAAISAIFTYALFNFHFLNDQWSPWALINKYAGWYVLASYFCLGGWVATNSSPAKNKKFLKFFATFFTATAFAAIAFHAADMALPAGLKGWKILESATYKPLDVLMGNRNAWMLLFIAASLLVYFHESMKKPLIPLWSTWLLWILIPFAFLYNSSRAGWLVFLACLPVIFFEDRNLFVKKFLPALMIGAIIMASYAALNKQSFLNDHKYYHLTHAIVKMNPEMGPRTGNVLPRKYQGDTVRKSSYTDALALWLEHPVMGAGLGSVLARQQGAANNLRDIVDCTTLWLLAETGMAGNILFISFYCLSLTALWRRRNNPLQKSVFYILIAFGIMSLAHELLYTRFLWLLMGLALARSAAAESDRQSVPR